MLTKLAAVLATFTCRTIFLFSGLTVLRSADRQRFWGLLAEFDGCDSDEIDALVKDASNTEALLAIRVRRLQHVRALRDLIGRLCLEPLK